MIVKSITFCLPLFLSRFINFLTFYSVLYKMTLYQIFHYYLVSLFPLVTSVIRKTDIIFSSVHLIWKQCVLDCLVPKSRWFYKKGFERSFIAQTINECRLPKTKLLPQLFTLIFVRGWLCELFHTESKFELGWEKLQLYEKFQLRLKIFQSRLKYNSLEKTENLEG